MTAIASRLSFLTTLLAWGMTLVSAKETTYNPPYFIVTSGKPRCFVVEAAEEDFLRVSYHAPDLVLDKGSTDHGSTYLTILEVPLEDAVEVVREEEGDAVHHTANRRRKPPQPISHEILHHTGSFAHKIAADADIRICVRASTAGESTPLRFSLHVDELGDEEAAESTLPPAKIDRHLSFMEQQFSRIESDIHAVLREADLSRDRDAIYHSKTDAMHKAVIFWPIMHVCILLATGFTQINHIVQFFKKRKII